MNINLDIIPVTTQQDGSTMKNGHISHEDQLERKENERRKRSDPDS